MISYIIESTPNKVYLIEEVADTNIKAIKFYDKLGLKEYKRKALPRRFAENNGINHLISLKYVR